MLIATMLVDSARPMGMVPALWLLPDADEYLYVQIDYGPSNGVHRGSAPENRQHINCPWGLRVCNKGSVSLLFHPDLYP